MRGCIVALGLVACGPSVAVDHAGTDGSTGADDGDPTSASAASTMPDPGTTMPGTTMTSSSDDDDESGAADDYPSFVDPTPDVGAPPITGCSIWERDCPVGMKCMPYSNDGASSWNDTICTPVADEPQAIGDPCTASEGPVAGVDDCDVHSMCWDVDPETLEGTCVSFCSGSADDPSCDDPTTTCIVANEGALVLCLPSCHPLDAPCSDGLCTTLGEQFFCLPEPAGVGGPGDSCDYPGACGPGLHCLDPGWLPDCEAKSGCCSPFCDTTAEMPCAEGLECVPWYDDGEAPEGFETLGVCAVQP